MQLRGFAAEWQHVGRQGRCPKVAGEPLLEDAGGSVVRGSLQASVLSRTLIFVPTGPEDYCVRFPRNESRGYPIGHAWQYYRVNAVQRFGFQFVFVPKIG
jgi:hypothetical protein